LEADDIALLTGAGLLFPEGTALNLTIANLSIVRSSSIFFSERRIFCFTLCNSYQDAERRTKLYADQYRLASKTLDILFKSFASSSASLTDILRVRQQTLDYEYKQTEAVADYNTSIAWLKRLMAFSQIQ